MSYLHCHEEGCGWAQDDFWSKRYNPITKIWSNVKWLIKPRLVEFDIGFYNYDRINLIKYTKVYVFFWKNKRGFFNCFSWNLLLLEIVKDIKNALRQKWWTYAAFKKAYDNGAVCPNCGKRNFDID